MLGHLGFTWEALPSIGWEFIPFSWIGDYFTTAGSYLEDVFYSPPGSTIYVTLNRKYTYTSECALTHIAWKGGKVLDQKSGLARVSFFSFDRQKLSSLPHRDLRFKTMDEVGLGSIKKLLNLAALLK